MKVRVRTGAALVLCLAVTLARPQIGTSNASQTASAVTEEMRTAARTSAASGCNAGLWEHVYRRTRLRIVASCIAVTGTIRHIRGEPDGDRHIQLAVNPEFSKLLNKVNKSSVGNTLILEPICQLPVTQADANAACHNFHSAVLIPKAGTKVRVVGSYVLDTARGWMEIHPVSSIQVLR